MQRRRSPGLRLLLLFAGAFLVLITLRKYLKQSPAAVMTDDSVPVVQAQPQLTGINDIDDLTALYASITIANVLNGSVPQLININDASMAERQQQTKCLEWLMATSYHGGQGMRYAFNSIVAAPAMQTLDQSVSYAKDLGFRTAPADTDDDVSLTRYLSRKIFSVKEGRLKPLRYSVYPLFAVSETGKPQALNLKAKKASKLLTAAFDQQHFDRARSDWTAALQNGHTINALMNQQLAMGLSRMSDGFMCAIPRAAFDNICPTASRFSADLKKQWRHHQKLSAGKNSTVKSTLSEWPLYYVVGVRAEEDFNGLRLTAARRLRCFNDNKALQNRYLKSALLQILLAVESAHAHLGGYIHGNLTLGSIFEDAVLVHPSAMTPIRSNNCPIVVQPTLNAVWRYGRPNGRVVHLSSADALGYMFRLRIGDTMQVGASSASPDAVNQDLRLLARSVCSSGVLIYQVSLFIHEGVVMDAELTNWVKFILNTNEDACANDSNTGASISYSAALDHAYFQSMPMPSDLPILTVVDATLKQ